MNYHLSNDAEQDIADIYSYSYQQFGEAKVESYYQALLEHFENLARNSAMGRDFSFVKVHTRRSKLYQSCHLLSGNGKRCVDFTCFTPES